MASAMTEPTRSSSRGSGAPKPADHTNPRGLLCRYPDNDNNEAERGVRPIKVQQRTSGGCWRTLQGLADFAVVQSYLSTAAEWHIDALDALTKLLTTGPWLPQHHGLKACRFM